MQVKVNTTAYHDLIQDGWIEWTVNIYGYALMLRPRKDDELWKH